MPESFLHERSDFKAFVATVADSDKINDPALVEKDYWIMHAVFGLKQLGLTFELKGGTFRACWERTFDASDRRSATEEAMSRR
jgi:hypothetical protein